MKNITLAILLILLVTGITFSQSKPVGTLTQMNNISSDGNTNYVSQPISTELKNLTNEVKKAKNNGDLAKIKFYQDKINALTGASVLNTVPESSVNIHLGSEFDNQNYTVLNSTHRVASGSIGTNRVNGTLYTVYTNFIDGACDEMYFYKSTNNGISWTNSFFFSISTLTNLNYRNNEIDIEVVTRGDSTFIWGVAGAENGAGLSSVIVFRCREDGNDLNVRFLNTPTTGIKLLYPRITSDNARFTVGSYVYISYTLDSITGSSKTMKSKASGLRNTV